jgi:hypothetical protein
MNLKDRKQLKTANASKNISQKSLERLKIIHKPNLHPLKPPRQPLIIHTPSMSLSQSLMQLQYKPSSFRQKMRLGM